MTTLRTLASCLLVASLAGCVVPTAPRWPDLPFDPGLDESGVPLDPAENADATMLERQRDAERALEALRADPTDESAIIWYGRRLAYLGRYAEAIDVYGRGLRIHPESPRLLRHRGHRWISLRRFDEAVGDLLRASLAIAGQPDEVEPDGQPNDRGMPTSTLHTNIWYHLGLARYCRGEFHDARFCYERCLAAAKNPDMEAATRYWLYLTATRLGDLELATRTLEPVDHDWDVIENHAYHRLLLLYRGDLTLGSVAITGEDAIQNLSLAYGLARYEYLRGDEAAGEQALRRVAGAASSAFGCIAAEADIARADAGR